MNVARHTGMTAWLRSLEVGGAEWAKVPERFYDKRPNVDAVRNRVWSAATAARLPITTRTNNSWLMVRVKGEEEAK